MRKILSLLCKIRQKQLEFADCSEARLRECGEMYGYLDSAFNGVSVEGRGFAGPETRLQEAMTSADFTYAIQEFVQRQMQPAYMRKRFEFEPLVKPSEVPNRLTVTDYQRRAALDFLEYRGEKGEPRPGSVVDATKRAYRVYTWSKQYDFDSSALINDNLGYFSDLAAELGEAARASQEAFVSRMYTNATTTARLVALGANYSQSGRLTTARISEARMAFNQRTDARGNPVRSRLTYLVHHSGLVDTVRQIRASEFVPELATNAANVIAGDFIPIEDPWMAGTAPNLPWYAFSDWRDGIIPFILARRQGMPGPLLVRKMPNSEVVTSLLGAGVAVSPMMGDFATGNILFKVEDEWGTYIDSTEGNLYDFRGAYYSDGTAP